MKTPASADLVKVMDAARARWFSSALRRRIARYVAGGVDHVSEWRDRFVARAVTLTVFWARTRKADPALAAEVAEIAARLSTQDNRATDAPIFIVQEKHRVYGFDPAYSDEVVWRHCDGEEADAEEHARLEATWEAGDDEPEEWTRTAYVDEWRFVTACFTEAGCQDYIRVNKHNHRGELRIYAAGSWRNEEWRAVRRLLLAIAGGAS